MIKCALFDMDGLMFDTEKLSIKGWEKAGQKYGYTITPDDVKSVMGVIIEDANQIFKQRFGNDFDFYKLRKYKADYIDDCIKQNGIPIKKGLVELLKFLKQNNYKTAVTTSNDENRTMFYLQNAKITNYFDKIICGNMVKRGKPDPDIYLEAANQLGERPEYCIALEDSKNGLLSASRAGCKVIAVPDTQELPTEITNLCFKVVDSLLDVIDILKDDI